MKNNRWFRMIGWLLALVMLLTLSSAVSFAEENDVASDFVLPPVTLFDESVDVTDNAQFAFEDASGNSVTVEAMDPNQNNRMKVTVSGLDNMLTIDESTKMTIALPENIWIPESELSGLTNDDVTADIQGDELIFSWKTTELKNSFEVSFTVIPNVPADNDLSGRYLFVTRPNKSNLTALVGSEKWTDSGRLKLKSYKVTEEEGKLNANVSVKPVWVLKHVTGNYYTVYSEPAGQYLQIILPNNATLQEIDEEHAQKLLIERNSDGYYTIRFSGVGLNNSNDNPTRGFASWTAGTATNEQFRLYAPSDMASDALILSANGGTAADPKTILGNAGDEIILPDLNSTKNGDAFIGWCEVDSIYKQTAGTKHTYHDLYKPGTTYEMKSGRNTLYAIYNYRGTKTVRFGIRKDGVIQDEPNGYDVRNYIGHFDVDRSILKETHWVIDIDSTKPVNGYYIENDITANLNWMPSAEQIAEALQKEGKVEFDPETQYIHYYVLKNIPDTTWKIDGVIRNKSLIEVTYNANVPGTEKTKVLNMPGGYQVAVGSEIEIGTNKNSTEIMIPTREGYIFNGWNTAADGTGTSYSGGHYLVLKNNMNLYAQWINASTGNLIIVIKSDWQDGRLGYIGARITMTAELTGFEGKQYDLQWQYSTDKENWHDIEGANKITYIYSLDEVNTKYTWRCVARNVH